MPSYLVGYAYKSGFGRAFYQIKDPVNEQIVLAWEADLIKVNETNCAILHISEINGNIKPRKEN